MSKTARVLLTDDDQEFCLMVSDFLKAEGEFDIDMRHDGESGAVAAIGSDYDAIILDVGLPKLNGFEVLKEIRQTQSTPVLMLTARGDDIDRILGLEIGADDYLPKPCNLRELLARIRAVLRRTQGFQSTDTPANSRTLGDLRIEFGSQSVYRDNAIVPLTGAEYLVLETLTQAAGKVVDKDQIARHALGREVMPYDRSVDAHIANLRKKLGLLYSGRQRIKTIRGKGYLYVTES
ncbi:MAG: response regulator transcription factor [Halieaceae bacterium]